jgi:hypothetical protein
MTGTSLVVFYISQHISSCYEACGRLGLSGWKFGLKFTVSSGNFLPFSQLGLDSNLRLAQQRLAERYLNGSQVRLF